MTKYTLFALLCTTPLLAAEPPKPVEIKFPVIPKTPPKEVAPPPAPKDAPVALGADTLYVVKATGPLMYWAVPTDVLKIEARPGPMTIHGRFVDGSGKPETRDYPDKFLLIVTAAKTGEATLLVWPAGSIKREEIKSQVITANLGPRPPPHDDKVEPAPKPPIPKAASVYVAVIHDPFKPQPHIARLLGDTAFWDSLKTQGVGDWDIYPNAEVDDAGQPTDAAKKNYLSFAARHQKAGLDYVPVLLILDLKTGKVLKNDALPGDKAGILAALKEVVK